MYYLLLYMWYTTSLILLLTRSFNDPEFCLDSGSETSQDQEYFERVAELQ